MNDKQLGFDPTINTFNGKRYIEIERHGKTERVIINSLIKWAFYVAGRTTIYRKGYLKDNNSRKPLVIKDS